MDADSTATKPKWWRRFTDQTSLYGLELVLAVFGLLTIAGVITYGLFLIGSYINGIGVMAARVTGEISIWVVAIMLVWLPIALLLYCRTSGEHMANPVRQQSVFYKAVISTYKFLLIVTAIGLLFAAAYSLMRLALDVNVDVKETLLTVTVPAFLSAAVNVALLFVYTRSHMPTRRVVVPVLAGVSLAIMVTLFVFAVDAVRTASQDTQKEGDITVIASTIGQYYDRNGAVPANLSDLEGLDDGVKNRLQDYAYTRKSDATYQLCADFLTDTQYPGYYLPSGDEYMTYVDSSSHPKGEYCFKLTPTYDAYKDEAKTYEAPADDTIDDSSLFN